MKSFNDAITIFKESINNYKKLCEASNSQPLTDQEAFIRNLIPFTGHHGGLTGHHRATVFITAVESAIKKNSIRSTEELIQFAINYQDKGKTLSDFIWEAVREAAGFSKSHVDYLASQYADHFSNSDQQESAKNLIQDAISGQYKKELVECLKDDMQLNQNCLSQILLHSYCTFNDYGQKLLVSLNKKIQNHENTNVMSPPSPRKKA